MPTLFSKKKKKKNNILIFYYYNPAGSKRNNFNSFSFSPPKSSSKDKKDTPSLSASVIFLHGLGNNAENQRIICQPLAENFPHIKFIIPQATVLSSHAFPLTFFLLLPLPYIYYFYYCNHYPSH